MSRYLSKLRFWMLDIGNDPELAVLQVIVLQRQLPLMYGLLLINSLAIALTHYGSAPAILTTSVPAVLFTVTIVRMLHWYRASRLPLDSPDEARRQLRKVALVAGPIALAYVVWALSLAPYGDSFEQAHVSLYISTTVIGCIFCLVALPQAAVTVALAVFPAFIGMLFLKGSVVLATIGVNIVLVVAVLVRVLLNSFENFRKQIVYNRALSSQRDELQRLNCDNRTLAMTDSLTALPNRRRFYADLEEFTARGDAFAVGILDLDRFKPINDTYGHQTGDKLLAAVASRLRETASPRMRVYRLGGDEFGLIDLDVTRFEPVCRRMLQQIHAPVRLGDLVISVGGSLGVALYPDAGTASADLFDRADYALYHAKQNSEGLRVFTASLETAARAERAVEAALQASSLEDEISIVLQPIVRLADGTLTAVEVLARWNSALIGEIPPGEFIAIAERSSAIHSITRVVFRKGLEAAKLLPRHVALSFNVSACDLNSATTLAFIQREIASAGIAPERIWIEITETAVMRNPETAAEAMYALKDAGVRLALDDFGTGYSSLSYVHRLPLDKIKIDRSFVQDLGAEAATTITSAVITLCHTMGLACVAEGVETAAQREVLMDTGCEYAQGYLFSKPLPVAELLRWHAAQDRAPDDDDHLEALAGAGGARRF